MYKIHGFDEAFFFLATVAMITEHPTILVPIVTFIKERNSFIEIMQLINSNYFIKSGVKQRKTTLKNCCKGVSSTPLLWTPTLTIGSKCSKNDFRGFYYHLLYAWVDLICSTCLIFLKSPWWLVWTFCAKDLLKGTILSSIIFVL